MNWVEFSGLYGHRKVKFVSYYKYVFVFKGDGLSVNVGGNHDDIYRLSVEPDKEYEIKTLPVSSVYKDGVCIYEGW